VDKTARDLIKLLDNQDLNLRLAAMRVVSALEMRQKGAVQGIAGSLESESEAVQVQALRSLAQLGAADALHLVAPKILAGGAVRQSAAQVLALSGAAAITPLRKLYTNADLNGRRAIASTLGEIGGRNAFQMLLQAMPAEDLEMIKHLTTCARQALSKQAPAAHLAALGDVRTFIKKKATLRNPQAVVAGLILLGGFSQANTIAPAQAALFPYLDAKQPEVIRRNAAISLSRLHVDRKKADLFATKLLPLLCERDWAPVVQNLLPLLQRLELSANGATKLLPLLAKSPHVAVRAHVLERLHGMDKPAIVKVVLPYLTDANPKMRESAEATLKTMPGALEPLFDVMARTKEGDVARRVQWILRAYPESTRKAYAPRAAERFLTLHEKQDPMQQVFLDFAASTDAPALHKKAAASVAKLKRSTSRNRWDRIGGLLGALADKQVLAPDLRYDYAMALLRHSKKDIKPEVRGTDGALRVLSGLARQDGAKLVRALTRDATLGADDYYYIGFHWSEEGPELRPHAKAVLRHVVESYPRHKLQKSAKHKLELLERTGAEA
jgi:HEAT repeat protein